MLLFEQSFEFFQLGVTKLSCVVFEHDRPFRSCWQEFSKLFLNLF